MSVFDEAHSGLSGIFEGLRREVTRIENLDAQTRAKQQSVDNLTQQETELADRVRKAQANLDELNTTIAAKVDEHEKAKTDFDALKASAKRFVSGL